MSIIDEKQARRQRWIAVLARATLDELEWGLRQVPDSGEFHVLRGPEIGLVMARGRAGGGGAGFNLGEMTVTRCTVRGANGAIGHATLLGRHHDRAKRAAVLDAWLQDPECGPRLEADVVAVFAARQATARGTVAAKAAATQVQFFTLATMRS